MFLTKLLYKKTLHGPLSHLPRDHGEKSSGMVKHKVGKTVVTVISSSFQPLIKPFVNYSAGKKMH